MDPAPLLLEPRLELIDARLVVGGTLRGSHGLAARLLADYGPPLALPLAPVAAWRRALTTAYPGLPLGGPPEPLDAWARRVPAPTPTPTVFARGGSHADRAAREALRHGLYLQARADGGRALGPDFVMRLGGGEGLTPDLLYLRPDHTDRLHSYHLEGPADLVLEVTHAARRDLDLGVRRQRYAQGGVPAYWVVEPATKTVHCWRRASTGYDRTAATQGTLEAGAAAGGLRLDLGALWAAPRGGQPTDPFLSRRVGDTRARPGPASPAIATSDEPGWDALPFAPAAGMDPVPIRFEQYLAWCPEAKFERLDGRLTIASDEGTRRVMALLAMTLGLRKIARYLPPLAWVVFLNPRHYLPAIEADCARLLEQARLAASDVGATRYWVGTIPGLPVRAVAGTQATCRRALERGLRNHLLYRLAST